MQENDLYQFVCSKCGSDLMVRRDYVCRDIQGFITEDGDLGNRPPILNLGDSIGFEGYRCGKCGEIIEHCGNKLMTKEDCIEYLSIDPVLRAEQQKQWDDHVEEIFAQLIHEGDPAEE